MKKSLLVLFFLLFLLIVSCVYQKTYSIYSEQSSTENNASNPVLKTQTISQIKLEVKAEKTEIEREPEPTLLERIKASVTALLESDETAENKKSTKTVLEQKEVSEVALVPQALGKEEQEIVDYLLNVLKERDLALAERDKVEAQLQDLINKALEERRIAIDHMHGEVERLQKEQQRLLDERDLTAKLLEEKNTHEEGK